MRSITYKDEKVKSIIEKQFIPFRVDVDYFTGMDIADRYKVKKYPTVITLDYNGNVLTFTEGFIGAEEILGILD